MTASQITTFGHISEYQPELEAFETYQERARVFLLANNIPDERRVPVLLSVIGASNFSLLSSLVSPESPSDKSVDEILDVLRAHFAQERITIAERFRFYNKSQGSDESVAKFTAELRRLAIHCQFGGHLDEALRDRFVCGLRSSEAQKRLLAKKNLTFQQAIEIASHAEVVETDVKAFNSGGATTQAPMASEPVFDISSTEQSKVVKAANKVCFRCGKDGHWPSNCKFRGATCRICGKRGHISTVCRSTDSKGSGKKWTKARAQWVGQDRSGDGSDDELGVFRIHAVKSQSPPIFVTVMINECEVSMEVDTGAAVSIVSEQTRRKCFGMVPVMKTDLELRTYTSEPIKVLGKCSVAVKYGTQSVNGDIYIVEGHGPSLLGRDLLRQIKLDWASIAAIRAGTEEELLKLFDRYHSVFDDTIGTFRHHQASLHVKEGAVPKYFRPRPIPFALKAAVEQELDRLEAQGILQRVSSSEWAAPIVVVPKKNGQIRICGDYKVTVNPALEIDIHPLPKPQELFASLAGGEKFTKLDLSQAYQQLRLEDTSKELVTINTHKGLYRYSRLPFGVASAPAIFQRTMDNILQGISRVQCYIDDILVSGVDDADHLRNLDEVLRRLAENGVTVKKEKCSFLCESVEYLGHVIDRYGLHAAPDKLKAIVDAPAPTNVQELRSFLGLINYYGKFIPDLASVLGPLNNLLRRDVRWKWSKECVWAMTKVKESLVSSRVLAHYDPKLPISLATDASAYGLGAVISHITPQGEEKPVAFASRTLTPAERNYSQLEKEALSIVFGVKKFHQFLYGRRFTLITDHKPLTTILGPKSGIPTLAAARLQRWAILLSAYSFDIGFRGTKLHANADGLSRLPLPTGGQETAADVASMFNVVQMSSLPLTHLQLKAATRCDPLISKAMEYTKVGWPSSVEEELRPFWRRRNELTVEVECLLWGCRVVVPKKHQKKVLDELHKGHPGICRMKSLARSYVWWPKMDTDIEQLVKGCIPCIQVKSSSAPVPLHPWVWPSKPWKRIHVDFAGPLFNKSYLVVVDAHSKWPEVWEMGSTTATKTIEVLQHLFSLYGLPEQLVSDNGPQFRSEEFAEFMRQSGIKHYRSAVYHPATNGAVERFVKTLKQAIKTGRLAGKPSREVLSSFLLRYRSTAHAVTGSTPSELFLGRPLRTVLDLLRPSQKEVVEERQAKQKYYHDMNKREKVFELEQEVFARVFRKGLLRWEQGRVVEILGSRLLLIRLNDGTVLRRHLDQVQHCSGKSAATLNEDAASVEHGSNESSDISTSLLDDDFEPFDDVEGTALEPPVEPPIEPLVEPPVDEAQVEESGAQPRTPTSGANRRYPSRDRHPPDRPWFVSM